jgi:hypothetical protein
MLHRWDRLPLYLHLRIIIRQLSYRGASVGRADALADVALGAAAGTGVVGG